ncbi:hypothetical protein LIER_27169 [Lithospermum erythrorhizon]|uniref:Uncharacterized protein n=1 Tax=Lithospermum erythrorhizon TaxID=34254 RepID=A0AAV3REG0_LITER
MDLESDEEHNMDQPRNAHNNNSDKARDTEQEPQITSPPPLTIRMSTRQRTTSTRYPPHEYILLFDGGEPVCYQEAIESDEKEKWMQAMNEKMQSLYKNHTFKLVNKVPDSTILKNR